MFILILGLCSTAAAYYSYQTVIQSSRLGKIAEEAKEYQRTFEKGAEAFLNLNRNFAALFAASGQVSHAQFTAYMRSIDLAHTYPAIRIMGYVPRVASRSATAFEAEARKIFPSYKLQGTHHGREYVFPLFYHYPEQKLSDITAGHDYSGIPERWEAMEKARDLGVTVVSQRHATLIDPLKRPGVAMVTPIFDPARPTRTAEERRIALKGFVISIFVIEDMIAEIMGRRFKARFDLEIFESRQEDAYSISIEDLIYGEDHQPQLLTNDEYPLVNPSTVSFGNRNWDLYFFPKAANLQHEPLKSALLILPAGLLLSIGLSFLTWKLQQLFRIRRSQRDQSKHFESVFENHATGVYSLDLQRRILNANPRFLSDLEMKKGDLIGLPVEKLVDPEYVARTKEKYQEVLNGTAVAYDNVVITGTGKRIHLSIALIPVSIEGKITGFLGIAKNVTARELAERELRESRKMLQLVIDNIPQRIFWKDRESVYLGCNRKLSEDAGLSDPREVIGKTDYDLPWAAEADNYRKDDRETMDSGQAKINYEALHPHPDGTEYWVRASKIPLTNVDGETIGILGVAEDITERRALEMKLVQMAHHDSLTGLPNRAYFYDQLGQAISRSKRHGSLLALMYFDIDKFKLINDTHGHAIGDAMITMFAQRVKGIIREIDVLGRLGGDEFALIVEDLSSVHAAEIVADKIIEAMRPTFQVDELALQISTSIGIAFFEPGMAVDELVRAGDHAMYKAKKSGRNRFEVACDYNSSQTD